MKTGYLKNKEGSSEWHSFLKRNKGRGWGPTKMKVEYMKFTKKKERKMMSDADEIKNAANILVQIKKTFAEIKTLSGFNSSSFKRKHKQEKSISWTDFLKMNRGKSWGPKKMSKEYHNFLSL